VNGMPRELQWIETRLSQPRYLPRARCLLAANDERQHEADTRRDQGSLQRVPAN
jgi:hypothetical protein